MRYVEQYQDLVGASAVHRLDELARRLAGKQIVHVSSAASDGYVADMLGWTVPMLRELGVDVRWETLNGPPEFQRVARAFGSALQGLPVQLTKSDYALYSDVNRAAAERLSLSAEVVFIHDVSPLLMPLYTPRGHVGRWVWWRNTDCLQPQCSVWRHVERVLPRYQASVFSTTTFARPLGLPIFIIPPVIDAFSSKNCELPEAERLATLARLQIAAERPLLVEVTNFDCLADLQGVIEAYWLLKACYPELQLVLAGRPADDDVGAEAVLRELNDYVEEDSDIKVLTLPPGSLRVINALQRSATVVLQKSTHEDFGLAAIEALWKNKPVIGEASSGIGAQVRDRQTGFLVHSASDTAKRVRYLLEHPESRQRMGMAGHDFVRRNYLVPRHLRDQLTLLAGLERFAPVGIGA